MTSRPVLTTGLAVALIATVSHPVHSEDTKALAQIVPVAIESEDVERTSSVDPVDGSTISGGHLGSKLDCTPGPQAFAKRVHADGSLAWLYTANADKDCDGDGQPDGSGNPLFGNWTLFDPAFIYASTMSASGIHPSGDVFYYGQLLVASTIGGIVQGAWGAFVLRFSPGGVQVGQAYLGAIPMGTPPTITACEALCSSLSDSTLEQNGSGAIAFHEDTIAIGGWRRAPSPSGVGDKDIFIALLEDVSLETRWTYERTLPGSDDEVRDIAFDSNGNVYATGYFDVTHDGATLRLDGSTGAVTHYATFAGPLDDEGTTIEVDGAGGSAVVQVDGFFTDEMLIGEEVVLSDGMTSFSACYTGPLALVSVTTPSAGAGSCAGGQILSTPVRKTFDIPGGGTSGTEVENNPYNVQIVAGQGGNCSPESQLDSGGDCVALVERSDDEYLHVYGDPPANQEEGDLIELDFLIALPESHPKLTSIRYEVKSEYCSRISVEVGGGDAPVGTFQVLNEIEICPLDEPVITISVPDQVAQALGFWSSLPQDPLICRLRIELFGLSCQACLSPGKDSELDDLTAGSEFP